MRVLFVSRKFPPSVGGMQRLSYHLITTMQERVEVSAVTWGGSQLFLPLFLIYAFVKSIWIASRGIDLVHIGDPIIAPIGWAIKRLFRLPVVVTVHGLDITFPLRPYQWLIPRLLRSCDCLVCISESTRRACTERGIPAQKCTVIPPGVAIPPDLPIRDLAREWLEQQLSQGLEDAWVLLTVGRLVPRKGAAWFAEHVVPQLLSANVNVHYVLVGGGPDREKLESISAHPETNGRIHLLGLVPEKDLNRVYRAADLFIMANRPVPGDIEGFGLVALEAASNGLPVLAADLEGIKDAVVPERVGLLLPPGDTDVWSQAIVELLNHPTRLHELSSSARETVTELFTWSRMVDGYQDLFRRILGR